MPGSSTPNWGSTKKMKNSCTTSEVPRKNSMMIRPGTARALFCAPAINPRTIARTRDSADPRTVS